MRASKTITFSDLRSQSIELLRWRLARILCSRQLPFANGRHDFTPRNRPAGRPQRFEAEHGMREAFDRSMVLLHEVVEIFGVANNDGRLVSLVVVQDCCGVAGTLVDRELLRQPLVANRFTQEGLGRVPIACGRQQKVNCMACFVAA